MTAQPLGTLTRVDLRSIWKNEATHFTPWLAQAENLAMLAKSMGLPADGLELQGQEQAVGPFRADILCRNTEDDSLVLIENQLERTDHSHLGQLLTYAAGLKAVTLVWIAERFTEEHRAALDWLNEITDEGFNIFGFEIELWRIGESPPAPKFNVVVHPNEWTRTIQKARKAGIASTPVSQLQLAYWTSFSEFLSQQNSPFRAPKPYPSDWMSWGLGRAGVSLLAFINAGHIMVGIDVNSHEHPTWFHKLVRNREAIALQVGAELDWDEKPGNKTSTIRCRLDLDMRDEANWPEAHEWILRRMSELNLAFRPLVRELDDEPVEADAVA